MPIGPSRRPWRNCRTTGSSLVSSCSRGPNRTRLRRKGRSMDRSSSGLRPAPGGSEPSRESDAPQTPQGPPSGWRTTPGEWMERPRCTVPARAERGLGAPGPLLDGDGGAGALEVGLGLLGGVLGDLLQDRLRRVVDQVLGLLEAERGEATHLLDDLDLLVAGTLEDDVELVLLGSG